MVENCDKKTPLFSFDGRKVTAKCVKVVDGDTAHFAFDIGNDTFRRFVCRFAEINAPEISTMNGVVSKGIVIELLQDKIVNLELGKFDKYGRLLVKIYKDDVCVNDFLVEGGYAAEYKM